MPSGATKWMSFTIYSKADAENPGSVGISFQSTPNLTSKDVRELADELSAIANEMEGLTGHGEEQVQSSEGNNS